MKRPSSALHTRLFQALSAALFLNIHVLTQVLAEILEVLIRLFITFTLVEIYEYPAGVPLYIYPKVPILPRILMVSPTPTPPETTNVPVVGVVVTVVPVKDTFPVALFTVKYGVRGI